MSLLKRSVCLMALLLLGIMHTQAGGPVLRTRTGFVVGKHQATVKVQKKGCFSLVLFTRKIRAKGTEILLPKIGATAATLLVIYHEFILSATGTDISFDPIQLPLKRGPPSY